MSEPVLTIESALEKALHDAIALNVEALKTQCTALEKITLNGGMLEFDDQSGNAGKRRDSYTGPRIDIIAAPNIPQGFGSNARAMDVTIEIITHPDDDPLRILARYAYRCARKIFDNNEFILPEDAMELRGYLITGGSSAVTEIGFVTTFSVNIKVFVKQAGV